MNTDIMKYSLNLEERTGYQFAEFYLQTQRNGIAVKMKLDQSLKAIYQDYMDELMSLTTSLYRLCQDEANEELEEGEEIPTLNLSAIANHKGNEICIYLRYVNHYKKGYQELIEATNKLNQKLNHKLTTMLDKFVDREENLSSNMDELTK